jgi:hypothetical protein
MMHPWGHCHVTSALEVFFLLTAPPRDPEGVQRWSELLSVEPPVWGSEEVHRRAHRLASRGLRLWTWDEYAVVFSDLGTRPPRGVHYRPWHMADDHRPPLLERVHVHRPPRSPG